MNRSVHLTNIALLAIATAARVVSAEDWGSYRLVPVSAQAMVLEAVDAGTNAETVVSINKPLGTANQRWLIMPKADGLVAITPAHAPKLVLAAKQGGDKNGTQIVLEEDKSEPWQLWALTKHNNGSYSLIPKHAPTMGLDDFGGKQEPGSRIDLWTYNVNDPHLQWFVKPLAGSGVPEPAREQQEVLIVRRRSSLNTSCPARPGNSSSLPARSFRAPYGT